MSKYLPVENLLYTTKLSEEQVITKLTENVEIQKSIDFWACTNTYSKPYIGQITGNTFEIKRAICYRNSFLPIIKGEVFRDFEGTKIKVNMKPYSFVLAFIIFWFGGFVSNCIIITYTLSTHEFDSFLIIPLMILLFVIILLIALLYAGFRAERTTSKKDLQRILEAEIERK